MKSAKIKIKIDVSKEFEDVVEEKYIQQILERVANRIAGELKWQVDNPNLAKEECFNIDKFNVSTEYGSTKSGSFAGAGFSSKTSTSSSQMFSSGSTMHSSMKMKFGDMDDFD